MQFGCCINVNPFVPQREEEKASLSADDILARSMTFLADAGYDCIEFPVRMIMNVPEERFSEYAQTVKNCRIPVPTYNGFIPQNLPVVGPQRDIQALREYLQAACRRMKALGGSLVVFGSGPARKIPEGYDLDRAHDELLEFLQIAGRTCLEHGITLVIEPLNTAETNVINKVDEGTAWAQRVQLPNVYGLADTYHMDKMGETVESLIPLARQLRHVHVADTGRKAPGCGSYDYERLRVCLEAGGYEGRIVVECHWGDFLTEAPQALAVLRKAWSD
jgi:D-psicose/D-tagatose/L-ribulose 3-epimerase